MDSIKSFAPDALEQVVKHVKIYFEGSLDVDNLGRFYFEQGRLRTPADATKEQYVLVSTVNQLLKDKMPAIEQ